MIQDINLLPKKVRKISIGAILVILLFSLVLVASGTVFGFVFPMQEKNDLKKTIDSLEEEIKKYNVSEAEYILLKQEVSNKKNVGEALSALKNNRLDITDLLNDLEASIPVEVFLEQVNVSGSLLSVDGTSLNYRDIAKFMVKLRKVDKLHNVTFTTASLLENEEKEKYAFSLFGTLLKRDIMEELQTNNPEANFSEGGVNQ